MIIEFTEEQLDGIIRTKVNDLLFNNSLEKIVREKLELMLFSVEYKHKARIDALEHKLEALSRNMDALASRLR